MKNIQVIAKNTFKEVIRDKILYSILAFALLFLLFTLLLGSISLGEDLKIIRDFGMAGIYIFSLIIAIFVGTSLVYKEIDKKTLYITLSKPISKKEFIVGKFFGLLLGIGLAIFAMTIIYLIVVAFKQGGFDWRGVIAILLSLFEIALFISLSILFSTFSKPLASTIYSVLILYIGHSIHLVLTHFEKTGGVLLYLFKIFYYILPNLEKFNLRNIVVHDSTFSISEISLSMAYGVVYCFVLLTLAIWSLQKQEL